MPESFKERSPPYFDVLLYSGAPRDVRRTTFISRILALVAALPVVDDYYLRSLVDTPLAYRIILLEDRPPSTALATEFRFFISSHFNGKILFFSPLFRPPVTSDALTPTRRRRRGGSVAASPPTPPTPQNQPQVGVGGGGGGQAACCLCRAPGTTAVSPFHQNGTRVTCYFLQTISGPGRWSPTITDFLLS